MKFVIVLTMPSGQAFVLGPDPRNPEADKDIALFPLSDGTTNILKGVWGFETEGEALKWMDTTSSMSEKGAKLMERCKPILAAGLQ